MTEQLHGAKCFPARRLCLPQVERDGLGRESVVSQRRGVESGARLQTVECCPHSSVANHCSCSVTLTHFHIHRVLRGFPGGSDGKESACNVGHLASIPELGRSWEEAWQPTPVFLPGESPWTEEPGGLRFTGLQSWTRLTDYAQHTEYLKEHQAQIRISKLLGSQN